MFNILYAGTMGARSTYTPAHVHPDHCELLYYTEGSGKLKAGGKTIHCREGVIVYIPPGVTHGDESKSGSVNMFCGIEGIDRLGAEVIVLHDNYGQEFKQILQQIIDNYFIKRPNWQMIASVLVAALVEYITIWKAQDEKSYYVDMCERILVANISNCDFSLSMLFDSIPLSKTHFTRVFKKEAGCTPKAYLDDKRMHQAIVLLKSASYSLRISEIAVMCGYSDQYHFSTAFKKKMGLSPAKWRTCNKNT